MVQQRSRVCPFLSQAVHLNEDFGHPPGRTAMAMLEWRMKQRSKERRMVQKEQKGRKKTVAKEIKSTKAVGKERKRKERREEEKREEKLLRLRKASCAPIISSGVVKVIFCDGRLEIYTRPVKAAELMLENPGQFVCDSCHLEVSNRIPGLSADEELERRHVYFLLPMEMLYSVLTNEELNSLTHRASKALKHGTLNFTKIFPVLGDFCIFPSEAKTLDTPDQGNPEPIERYSRQRSWMPALETIVETSPRRLL
ncbi:hypothetical protein F0562_025318 [Nyssa sinensis]|uniref:Uncharacterized protein n=1 Tax=Nyssa sinensis TaxID=561372 RepID=A0A5J5BE17_9ASTE|nr:hypothetical protein F0562_025318 [Nyssa sinensis]